MKMSFLYWIGCWEQDPHKRPSFKEILQELEQIAKSGFGETPNESFHLMQDGWKKEINEVLRELRNKEKVNQTVPKLTFCFYERVRKFDSNEKLEDEFDFKHTSFDMGLLTYYIKIFVQLNRPALFVCVSFYWLTLSFFSIPTFIRWNKQKNLTVQRSCII